ncbi:DUF6985 domain-containing protein [Aeoliella sp.]|uniref:DUF6985 domain-containing protein n=1 Tax=Aeoliella sp. TaxID=2795800 RepID=UPI003CCB8055
MTDANDTWIHEQLGEFALGALGWVAEVDLPSFARFDTPIPKGKYQLVLERQFGEDARPTADIASAAATIVETEANLSEAILQAVWDDLNGTGPDSRSRWYGKLAAEEIQKLAVAPPTKPDDLVTHLKFLYCAVTSPETGYEWWEALTSPIAMFNFNASWDDEHGIGVLVHRGEIVGIGEIAQVEPFRRPAEPPRQYKNPFTGEVVSD